MPSKINNGEVYSVIDANLNRAKEGLRVCEDTARFIFKNERLSRKIKKLRHQITRDTIAGNFNLVKALKFRDSDSDFGRKPDYLEKKRKSVPDIFLANFQRVKEALRVLEEFTKLIDVKLSDRFKKLRFRAYSLEKEIIEAL